VDSPLLSINKSILAIRTPIGSPLRLPISFSRKNPKKGLTVTHLEVGGLGVKSMFNENIIKPGDNKEYIEEAVNTIAILHIKQGYNCKNNMLAYLKASLN